MIILKLFLWVLMTTFFSLSFAKDLSCSHYYHTNIHGEETTILQWQETIPFALGESEKKLKEIITSNKKVAENLKGLIKEGQKEKAVLQLEKELNTKISPADSIDNLIIKLSKNAQYEKELLKLRDNDYSTITLKFIARYEEAIESNDFDISEGLLMTVKNKLTKVVSTYYHGFGNSLYSITDEKSKKLNEYKIDLTSFDLKHPQFGNVKFVSYKCVYPFSLPTNEDREKEYVNLINKLNLDVKDLRSKINSQAVQSTIKESPTWSEPPIGGGGSSSR